MEGWIKIYTAQQEYQVEVIKHLLENNELHPVMLDRKDEEFRIGTVDLYIAPEELEKAKQIIADNENSK